MPRKIAAGQRNDAHEKNRTWLFFLCRFACSFGRLGRRLELWRHIIPQLNPLSTHYLMPNNEIPGPRITFFYFANCFFCVQIIDGKSGNEELGF